LYDARSFLQLSDYTQRRNCSYRPAISHIPNSLLKNALVTWQRA